MSRPKHPSDRRVNRLRPQIDLQRRRLHDLLINAPSAHEAAEIMRTLHCLLYPAATKRRREFRSVAPLQRA
jgi:hypothetical protein